MDNEVSATGRHRRTEPLPQGQHLSTGGGRHRAARPSERIGIRVSSIALVGLSVLTVPTGALSSDSPEYSTTDYTHRVAEPQRSDNAVIPLDLRPEITRNDIPIQGTDPQTIEEGAAPAAPIVVEPAPPVMETRTGFAPLPELTPEQLERLGCAINEVTPALKRVLMEAQAEGGQFRIRDCERGKAEQNAAVSRGASNTRWPTSAHNVLDPAVGAMAVDIAPLDASQANNLAAYEEQARLVQGIAERNGITIDWGGDWKSLVDGPHLEIDGYRTVREQLSERVRSGTTDPDALTLAVAELQGNPLPTIEVAVEQPPALPAVASSEPLPPPATPVSDASPTLSGGRGIG